ncbi:MAG: glycosyltransferase family 4 protein [Chloroflexota bacterium]
MGTYLRHLAEHMARLEPDRVRFVTARAGREELPAEIRSRAVEGRRGHRPAQIYWLYNEWFLRRAIHHERPALFHATDFNGLVAAAGTPTIATLYDCTWIREAATARNLSQRLSDVRWRVYYHHKLARANHIIAISARARQDATELLRLPSEKITAIPLGVDTNRYRPIRGHGRFAGVFPYFLFVGGRATNKNLDRLLHALRLMRRSCPDARLLIAGPWSPTDRAWLRNVCADRSLLEHVQLLGFMPGADLPSLYANALGFVFPCLEEGFGLPVLEAMACGTPVITSNRSVLPEVAGNAALLIDPTDTEQLAVAMRYVAACPQLRSDLTRRGLERVREVSWETVARRTLDVYERVIYTGSR